MGLKQKKMGFLKNISPMLTVLIYTIVKTNIYHHKINYKHDYHLRFNVFLPPTPHTIFSPLTITHTKSIFHTQRHYPQLKMLKRIYFRGIYETPNTRLSNHLVFTSVSSVSSVSSLLSFFLVPLLHFLVPFLP